MLQLSRLEDKETSEFEMLNDRMLSNNFNMEHLKETLCYFLPAWDSTDIVEHGAALCKAYSFLYLLNKLDASEVHVVLVFAQRMIIVNGFWNVSLRATKLTCTKEEGQVLVVVKTPNSVWTSWLQIVSELELAHQNHVALENFVDCTAQVSFVVDTHFEKTEQKYDEVQLMPSSIIDPFIGTKWLLPVHFNLRDTTLKARRRWQRREHLVRASKHFVHQRSEGPVAEPHRLIDRRHFVDPVGYSFQ